MISDESYREMAASYATLLEENRKLLAELLLIRMHLHTAQLSNGEPTDKTDSKVKTFSELADQLIRAIVSKIHDGY